jgi:hypothetical protein
MEKVCDSNTHLLRLSYMSFKFLPRKLYNCYNETLL